MTAERRDASVTSLQGIVVVVMPMNVLLGACLLALVASLPDQPPVSTPGGDETPPVAIFVTREPSTTNLENAIDEATIRKLREELRAVADGFLMPLEEALQRGGANDDVLKEIQDHLRAVSRQLSPPIRTRAAGTENDGQEEGESAEGEPEG